MRKQNTNEPGRLAPSSKEILRTIGVGKEIPEHRFQQQVEKRFGRLGIDVLQRIERRAAGESDGSIWQVKNQNLDLSLLLSTQFVGGFYHQYLNWFRAVTGELTIRHILDIGCDNGALTCAYALALPDAKIVGIDTSTDGIQCATELARRLALQNVEFRNVSALRCSEILAGNTFDLITATMVYHSIREIPQMPCGWSLRELTFPDSSEWQAALSHVVPLLNSNGAFISVERLTGPTSVLWWTSALADAGLFTNWSLSDMLRYNRLGEHASLPALFCDPRDGCSDDLVADVLALAARQSLVQLATNPFVGEVAEALFESFSSRSLVWGTEAVFPNELMGRFEVWKAGSVILAYTYSNDGMRRLVIGPCHKQEECLADGRHFWDRQPTTRLREYRTTAERDDESHAR